MNQRIAAPQQNFALRLANPLALVLIILPIADVAFGLGDFSPSVLRWRVASIGLLSGAMLLPMIGFFVSLTAAHILDRDKLYRFLAVCCGLIGTALLLGAVLFALDAVQLRPQVSAETKKAYDIAGIKSLITQILEAGVFLAFCVTSFRMHRSAQRRASELRRMTDVPSPVVKAS